ncbi:MotA/TolQ/ExbB proton channel family protein [Endozoicomonas ascidiicola]|uniref:MotA/TolQ/ExbB proton channel family protein n=1 Tax=Endozoicomonas ascidiicola TaxID=1698521 RepID=UPI000B0576DF|nr:MotA/TolQ/ExbB proton channel family protein [Endozoicomonas ascidiicola]
MMDAIILPLEEFMHQGGPVLFAIALVSSLLWMLVFDRIAFLANHYPDFKHRAVTEWRNRPDLPLKTDQIVRERLINITLGRIHNRYSLINTIIAICPLLGLLGTVTGMLDVFQIMSSSGTGSARAMADGVSRATIPTMAGMVAALSGLLAMIWLNLRYRQEQAELSRSLKLGRHSPTADNHSRGVTV